MPQCPECRREMTTDFIPRAQPYSTLPEEQVYLRYDCENCGYNFLRKSENGEGEHLLK